MSGGVNGRRAAAAGAALGPACALLPSPLPWGGRGLGLPLVGNPRRPAAVRAEKKEEEERAGVRKRCEKPCPRPPGCRRGPPVPPPFTRAGPAPPGRPRPLRAARLATRTVRGRRPARGLALAAAGRGRPRGPRGELRCSLVGGPAGAGGGGALLAFPSSSPEEAAAAGGGAGPAGARWAAAEPARNEALSLKGSRTRRSRLGNARPAPGPRRYVRS